MWYYIHEMDIKEERKRNHLNRFCLDFFVWHSLLDNVFFLWQHESNIWSIIILRKHDFIFCSLRYWTDVIFSKKNCQNACVSQSISICLSFLKRKALQLETFTNIYCCLSTVYTWMSWINMINVYINTYSFIRKLLYFYKHIHNFCS